MSSKRSAQSGAAPSTTTNPLALIKPYKFISYDISQEQFVQHTDSSVQSDCSRALQLLNALEDVVSAAATAPPQSTSNASKRAKVDDDGDPPLTSPVSSDDESSIRDNASSFVDLRHGEQIGILNAYSNRALIQLRDKQVALERALSAQRGLEGLVVHENRVEANQLQARESEASDYQASLDDKERRIRVQCDIALASDEAVLREHPELVREIEAHPDEREHRLFLAKLKDEHRLRKNETHEHKERVDEKARLESELKRRDDTRSTMDRQLKRLVRESKSVITSINDSLADEFQLGGADALDAPKRPVVAAATTTAALEPPTRLADSKSTGAPQRAKSSTPSRRSSREAPSANSANNRSAGSGGSGGATKSSVPDSSSKSAPAIRAAAEKPPSRDAPQIVLPPTAATSKSPKKVTATAPPQSPGGASSASSSEPEEGQVFEDDDDELEDDDGFLARTNLRLQESATTTAPDEPMDVSDAPPN